MSDSEDVHKPSNREKARAPKRFSEWCPGCDRDLLAPGKKCRVCGVKLMQAREKK
jgi:rRNA maturation endonuclease Nob1